MQINISVRNLLKTVILHSSLSLHHLLYSTGRIMANWVKEDISFFVYLLNYKEAICLAT